VAEPAATPPPDRDFSWHVVSRRQEVAGEARANLVRAAGVAVFSGLEIAAYHGLKVGSFDLSYRGTFEVHRAVTTLCATWALASLVVLACLRVQRVPEWLKYATTAGDVAFLTAILTVSEGARSPATVAYFLILALSALRMSLPLVRTATALCALGWLWLLGTAEAFPGREATVPRYHQVVFLAAVLFAGILLGQVVRRARAIAEEYARRRDVDEPRGGA
jgi:hypothetical protein